MALSAERSLCQLPGDTPHPPPNPRVSSGNGYALLAMYRATGDDAYLAQAQVHAQCVGSLAAVQHPQQRSRVQPCGRD